MFKKDKKMIDCQRAMRDLVVFEKKIEDRPFDDLENYEKHRTVYGEIKHYKSKLVNQARAENTKNFIVAVIRYREDIDETMRMLVNKKYYQIESIIPINRENLYLEITGYKYNNDMGGEYLG